jgi:hypothetical protein
VLRQAHSDFKFGPLGYIDWELLKLVSMIFFYSLLHDLLSDYKFLLAFLWLGFMLQAHWTDSIKFPEFLTAWSYSWVNSMLCYPKKNIRMSKGDRRECWFETGIPENEWRNENPGEKLQLLRNVAMSASVTFRENSQVSKRSRKQISCNQTLGEQ